jgi:hypothetical protein
VSEAELDVFVLRIALPPVRLGLYVKRLEARRTEDATAPALRYELRRAERIRARLARHGWWN